MLNQEYGPLLNIGENFIGSYSGDAAEQFRAGWGRTKSRFQQYIDETSKISAMLEERIEALRRVVAEEGDLIG